MKLVVFGTSEFAVPILTAVADRHDVRAVVTQPDRPAGRGHKLVASPVKRAAIERAIPVLTPERLRPAVDAVRAFAPDALVVASYGKIVPQAMLDLVPIAFNVHPSLLPLYRGATPLQSVLRDGRSETGVTIIAMDAGMDTGDVLLQERVAIGERETYGELHDRTAAVGARLVVDALERYTNGTLIRTPQAALAVPETEIAATLTRPLQKADLVVHWSAPPERVVDRVRALAPIPAARATIDDETVKILAARLAGDDERAGTFTHDDGYVHERVVLLRVVPPNRAAMSGAAWRRSRVRA